MYPVAPELVFPVIVKEPIPFPTAPALVFPTVEEPPVEPPVDNTLKYITSAELTPTKSGVAYVTFGQPFAEGDLNLNTNSLVAKLGDLVVPVQLGKVSSFDSGSVRFGVVSAKLDGAVVNKSLKLDLYSGSKVLPNQSNFDLKNWDYSVELTIGGVKYTNIGLQTLSSAEVLEVGEVVKEYLIKGNLFSNTTAHPHLTVMYIVRVNAAGEHKTDVVIENTTTFKSGIKNYTYNVVIKNGTSVLFSQNNLVHYVRARWHKQFYSTGFVTYKVKHDKNYFVKSKAVLNYDTKLTVDSLAVTELASRFNSSNKNPMQPSVVQTYFPMTGSRDDIGMLPKWSVMSLLSQDDTSVQVMLGAADSAGGPGIHFRDDKTTGLPIDVETYPEIMVQYPQISQPAFVTSSDTTIWEPDRAHQPSFAYLPYLMTGDWYYMEEIQFWASWNIAMFDSGTRQGSKGIIDYDQTRAKAWCLRSVGEAAFATPDTHKLKKYYNNVIKNNMVVFSAASSYSPIGGLEIRDYSGFLTPWQQDFVLLALSWLAENKVPKAREAVDMICKYQVGRFVNTSNGFCYKKAMCYDVQSKNADGSWITTWDNMFRRNFPTYVGVTCSNVPLNEETYVDDTNGMSAMARASLASAINLNVPKAAEAYEIQKSITGALDANYKYNPTWAIVPYTNA